MKYIIIFLVCLSTANAGYSKVEARRDFVIFDKVKAINKRFIVLIEQKGPNVVIKYRRFPLMLDISKASGDYLVINNSKLEDVVDIIYSGGYRKG